MNDDGSAEDALFAMQSDAGVLNVDFGNAGTIRFYVAQISRVTLRGKMVIFIIQVKYDICTR